MPSHVRSFIGPAIYSGIPRGFCSLPCMCFWLLRSTEPRYHYCMFNAYPVQLSGITTWHFLTPGGGRLKITNKVSRNLGKMRRSLGRFAACKLHRRFHGVFMYIWVYVGIIASFWVFDIFSATWSASGRWPPEIVWRPVRRSPTARHSKKHSFIVSGTGGS